MYRRNEWKTTIHTQSFKTKEAFFFRHEASLMVLSYIFGSPVQEQNIRRQYSQESDSQENGSFMYKGDLGIPN